MSIFDREALYAVLQRTGNTEWETSLRRVSRERFNPDFQRTMPQWIQAWHELPDANHATIDAAGRVVSIRGNVEIERDLLRQTLMKFCPWRKGPFEVFGVPIDSEWRSDLKWDRLKNVIQFAGKTVLDVGCGNGYFGWRMLAEGAELVVGCDPFMLYLMQFEIIRKYAPNGDRHFIMPIGDSELPPRLHLFDIVFSMGVLYHRTSPIDHLQTLWNSLKANGRLVLETLIIDGDSPQVLVPEGRYAKMRNVWFVPSTSMLVRWLSRTGFREVEVIDVSPTTPREQRRTDWMTFESLADFLAADDSSRTVEGHPAPLRALVTAKRA